MCEKEYKLHIYRKDNTNFKLASLPKKGVLSRYSKLSNQNNLNLYTQCHMRVSSSEFELLMLFSILCVYVQD